MKGRTRIFTDAHKKNMSLARKGKKHTTETKRKMSINRKGHPAWNKGKTWVQGEIQCPHCNSIGGISGMKRWHFDNCKSK